MIELTIKHCCHSCGQFEKRTRNLVAEIFLSAGVMISGMAIGSIHNWPHNRTKIAMVIPACNAFIAAVRLAALHYYSSG